MIYLTDHFAAYEQTVQQPEFRPLHELMLNFSTFDEHPDEPDNLTINLDNIKRTIENEVNPNWVGGTNPTYPADCEMFLDFEERSDNHKWNVWPNGEPDQRVIDVLCGVVTTIRKVRPDIRLGIWNGDYQYFQAVMDARTNEKLQAQFERLQAAWHDLIERTDVQFPSLYYGDTTRSGADVAEWSRIVLDSAKKRHPRIPIQPFVCPVCSGPHLVITPNFRKQLDAIGEFTSDVVAWYVDADGIFWNSNAAWLQQMMLWQLRKLYERK
jgi:hypothetical protein